MYFMDLKLIAPLKRLNLIVQMTVIVTDLPLLNCFLWKTEDSNLI